MSTESGVTHQRPNAPDLHAGVDIAWSGHNRDLTAPLTLPGVPPARADVAQRRIVTLDGAQLRLARKRAGLSQKGLAVESGISTATVGKLERQPWPRCLFRTRALIATALGAHSQAITGTPDHGTGTAMAVVITAAPGEMTSGASRTCSQRFPARADQVRRARRFLRSVLTGCPMADDVLLICSELAANAVQHSASARPGGHFTVRAEIREGGYAWIEVEDDGGRWAGRKGTGERGRGLVIVAELAAYWDVSGDDHGRVVCARLDWPRPDCPPEPSR